MLRKMQRRFIIAAMASVALVMILIITGINLASFLHIRNLQDEKLRGIYEYEQMALSDHHLERPPISDMPWAGEPDDEFTTRFFVVHADKTGKLKVFGNDYITSVDEDTAERFTMDVLDKKRSTGSYGDYRYLVENDNEDLTLVFLNVSDEKQYLRSLMIASLCVGIFGLLLVLVLVVLISSHVVRPYARNIEKQKQFITDAGHELKTPITSIATSADIAAMEFGDSEWISNIQQQAARLASLTNDLVALSRLDEEMPRLERAEFSLSAAAGEVSKTFDSRAKADGKRYSRHIEDGIMMVGDRGQIMQMISILLDNAFKYSPAGGEIRLSVGRRKNKRFIEVYNTCTLDVGTDLGRLFDRFYRPDKSRSSKTGGSGLGLSIAQMTAEAHGGSISARMDGGMSIVFEVMM